MMMSLRVITQRQCIAKLDCCINKSSKFMSNMSGTHGKSEHIVLTANQSRDPQLVGAQISKITTLSPTVKGYKLKLDEASSAANFKAGQWVDFFIPSVNMIGGFSMCGPPSTVVQENSLDLAVKYSEWPPANWLHTKAQEGDNVSIRIGGDFFYPDQHTNSGEHDVLLIGGGVGINPLASIYFHISDLVGQGQSKCKKVHLLFTAKTKEELLFREKLDDVAKKQSEVFSLDYITTADEKRMDREKIRATLSRFPNHQRLVCYLCGPPQMIKDRTADLLSFGISQSHIKYELWW